MIYVIYGQPGSGKTTLGKLLAAHVRTPYHIDGDHFRKIFRNTDYSKGGRENNIRAMNTVATYLNKTYLDPVVVSLVNPYMHLRQELRAGNPKVIEVLLETDRELRAEYHVKEFEVGNPEHIINTDSPADDTWSLLRGVLNL